MTTLRWTHCLDRLEIGSLDLTQAPGRHRAADQPAIRIRRRRYARCGAPFTSAGTRGLTAHIPTVGNVPADPAAKPAPARTFTYCSTDGCVAGVIHITPVINGHPEPDLTYIDDHAECHGLGFHPTDSSRPAAADQTGRPGTTHPNGGTS